MRERSERAAQDSGALSELQEVLDRERGRADDLQVGKLTFTRFKNIVPTRTCEIDNCYKVSLNDSETERESLGKRLQTAEAKADQFEQVVNMKT